MYRSTSNASFWVPRQFNAFPCLFLLPNNNLHWVLLINDFLVVHWQMVWCQQKVPAYCFPHKVVNPVTIDVSSALSQTGKFHCAIFSPIIHFFIKATPLKNVLRIAILTTRTKVAIRQILKGNKGRGRWVWQLEQYLLPSLFGKIPSSGY